MPKTKAEIQPIAREYTVNLHKRLYRLQFKKRAPRAVKELRKFATQMMGTKDVRLDSKLNKFIWATGIKNVPYRVRVICSRKRNDNEDAAEKFYTLVTHVPVDSYKGTVTKVVKPKVAITVIKKIGGAKNGGERVVMVKKPKAYYPTKARVAKRGPKGFFSQHVRKTRKSLKPGRILILLAGHHAGKRVVFLKTLKSGLLLVNGPFFINGCPLRRISQRYVMATQTRLKLRAYRVPEHINDKYFKRAKKNRKARGEGDIFAAKKEKYVPSEQRKQDQIAADKALKAIIKTEPEKKLLFKYLSSQFGFKSSQYPHRMKF